MEADLIGLFALLVGLELILGVDNILVIAILVARLPEERRAVARNIGLGLAMGMRVLMVIGGLKLIQLTHPAWPSGPEWFRYSIRELALMGGGLFLIWKAVKEIHSTVELEDEEAATGEVAGFGSIIMQIVLLDMVFSLDSVITAVGLTDEKLIIIVAVIVSFVVILFFAKSIGEFIIANASLKILALAFLIVIGVTIFMEGMGKHVDKKLIYIPMGFAMAIQFLQMRYTRNKENVRKESS
jgi:predicted tellurium resistance membrane protein TerC